MYPREPRGKILSLVPHYQKKYPGNGVGWRKWKLLDKEIFFNVTILNFDFRNKLQQTPFHFPDGSGDGDGD